MSPHSHALKRIAQAGYTLIELCIVLTVVGFIMAGFATAYNIYLKSEAERRTSVNTALVTQKVGEFFAEKGRYPCPAALDLEIDNPAYGLETNCTARTGFQADGSESAAVNVGQCNFGICVEESATNVAGATPAKPIVVRGGIPFRALNLPEEYAYDGYHSRLVYAITAHLTSEASYNKDQGAITIIDGEGDLIVDPSYLAHFIVYSPGPDRMGGYTKHGRVVVPCTSGMRDSENCGAATAAVYRAASYSTASGTMHFDDHVSYASSVETPFWKIADDNRLNMTDLVGNKKIGIGREPGNTIADLKVDVRNALRVRDHASQADIDDDALAADDRGLLQTEELCSFTDDDCFIPSLIGGDERVMECGVDGKEPYAMGIRSGAVECTSGGFSPCQEGEFFVGGGCRSAEEATGVARCPAASLAACDGWPAINLPEAVVGEVRNNVQTGWSHYTNYRCSSVTRQWRRVSDNGGYCNCTDLNLPGEREACDGWFGEGEGTFTGDVTYDFTRVCDPDVGYPQDDWTNINETACQCAGPINEVWPESCPAGFQGQAQWRRTWTCNTATSGSWSEWELDQSGCTCTPRTEERERSCPGGFPGAILERSTMTCPSSVDGEVTWSEWEEISNTCSCTVSTQNRNASCPAGTTGTVTESRTRSCPSATWSDWTVTATNCTCQPQTIGPEQFPCPQGYTGYILKTQQVTCPGPVFGPWTNVPDGNNCQPIIYRWKAIGTATQTGASSAWGSPVNSQCSPQGARDRCHRVIPGGGGTVDNYAECECQ